MASPFPSGASSSKGNKTGSPANTSSSSGPMSLLSNNYYVKVDDDFEEIEETETLRNIVSKAAKYGSISSHTSTSLFPHNQKFITHVVQPQDTLQGLALKYSVTMEQIRRANRLYTSDSLFCKSVLSIPVPDSATQTLEEDPDDIQIIVGEDTDTSDVGILLSLQDTKRNNRKSSNQNHRSHNMSRSQSDFSWSILCSPSDQVSSSDPSSISLNNLNGSGRLSNSSSRTSIKKILQDEMESLPPDETADDFLSRIDSSIARTKDQVAKNQQHSNITSDTGDSLGYNSVGPSTSSKMRFSNKTRSIPSKSKHFSLDVDVNGHNSSSSPNVIITDNKVRYSIRRLEKEQDELFQL